MYIVWKNPYQILKSVYKCTVSVYSETLEHIWSVDWSSMTYICVLSSKLMPDYFHSLFYIFWDHLIIVVKNSLLFLMLDRLCPCATTKRKVIALLVTCKVELNLNWPAIHVEETATITLQTRHFLSVSWAGKGILLCLPDSAFVCCQRFC